MSLKDVMNKLKGDVAAPADFDIGAALWGYYASLNEAPDEGREDGFHPSQLYGFCPRQEVLRFWFPIVGADLISPELQMKFDWGTAWHWLLQNHRLGPMGHLWGDWKCERCGEIVKDTFMPPPHTFCRSGGEKVWLEMVEEDVKAGKRPRRGGYWRYLEPRMKHRGKDWQIVGQADGIMYPKPWLKEGDPFLLEIKTIDGELFKILNRPDPKYVFQIRIYLHYLGLPRCLLTYWTKAGSQAKPKAFWVYADKAVAEDVISRIMLYLRAWPEKRLCPGICGKDETNDAGKWCAWRTHCFASDIEDRVEKARAASTEKEGKADAG